MRHILLGILSGAPQAADSAAKLLRTHPTKTLKWRDVYLKLTRHNGRAGTHGTYNPKHNDRSFNLANSEHIDPERAKGNIYWDCFHGFRSALAPQDPDDLTATFSDVERQFYGEVAPQQEKALEALGFDLPDPAKPLSRSNNRKITFDAACRKMLFEIAKRHGLELEKEAEYGNRQYLEKQDYILAKQKEQLAAQQNRLDELTLKVNDMEALIDEVSAAAYDKAVEVVADVVRTETHKEDMRMIEDTKKWVLSPERKAPQATREYAAHRLDTVLDKFLKTMQTASAHLQEALLKPEVRQKGKEQVKEKARDSVLQLLSRLQAEQPQRKPGEQHTAEKSETRGDVY